MRIIKVTKVVTIYKAETENGQGIWFGQTKEEVVRNVVADFNLHASSKVIVVHGRTEDEYGLAFESDITTMNGECLAILNLKKELRSQLAE